MQTDLFLKDIVDNKIIMTHKSDLGYEINIYLIVEDGLQWQERHVINYEKYAIKKHNDIVVELQKPKESNTGACGRCGKEALLVFKRFNGDRYCSLCRDLFIESCQ